ncbi:tonB-system energizer ExbB [Novosphingobium profundi]|uniref:tonB-system energizer ExbB n=1 Tax=Novosphingobium profundi TaxID=1774954 RepID=UPI001BDACE1E|nr:tonB-system energizer ExbB [Novosphingobium profundi]MBT0671054.1 tonB-system energizer ExbB [Novosphingobium profundi]
MTRYNFLAVGSISLTFATAPQAAYAAAAGILPSELSVGAMFVQADWLVKVVMIGLALASVATWTIFVAKLLELRKANASEKLVHDQLVSLRSLRDAALDGNLAFTPLVREALSELRLSSDALADPEGIKERVVSRFQRHEAAVTRRMTRGVNVLATIGATAPFVGLFGTVWGIMNSFIGIAEKQTTNLAVVAPGIAEALLATAIGLVAAIPAVVIYNHFARQIAAHKALVSDSAAAILRLVSRDLSRGQALPLVKEG